MTASYDVLKTRTRGDYPFTLEYRTRWADNDMYQHMNNSIYNFLYDSVINSYLIEFCDLKPASSPQHGMVVHSHNDYFGSISFPSVAELCLRVNKLGRTSVTYEIALFEKGVDRVRSVGEFVQVFVDRATGRPAAAGMNETTRKGLERIMVQDAKQVLPVKSKL
ncbi:thioesterase [Pyricularia oryzae 70-15]|uniref:Thioesterase n=2 Tax=Pyricularia oryzae TaxID=318829 RepID=G4MYD0_PYRO7|nr:thioesterase [Pyricularia oryzae 70-15]EHA55265.1 thioesterase [Pyricularia oryzae 70-15]KAI7916046.1 thioesterase [Pyricularia oryzae]KAI7926289.1 thioesterase [Pyricularia oryzae]QBZ56945.1 hypothetical protein PoMZ_01863 [Pyricularia oryzae]